jgi:creatinine amidohydrolase
MPYIALVCEMCRSIAKMGATKVFLLNGHGGNDIPVRAALRELKTEFPKIQFVFACYWALAAKTIKNVRESEMGGLGHACEMEASIMLYLHPEKVNMKKARRDGRSKIPQDTYRKGDMMSSRPIYLVNEFDEISDSGTVGFPDLASAEKGQHFINGIVDEVLEFVDDFAKW